MTPRWRRWLCPRKATLADQAYAAFLAGELRHFRVVTTLDEDSSARIIDMTQRLLDRRRPEPPEAS